MAPTKKSSKKAILQQWFEAAQEFTDEECSLADFANETSTLAMRLYTQKNDPHQSLATILLAYLGSINATSVTTLYPIDINTMSPQEAKRVIKQLISLETTEEEHRRKRLMDHELLNDEEFTQGFLYLVNAIFIEAKKPPIPEVTVDKIRQRLVDRHKELKAGLH